MDNELQVQGLIESDLRGSSGKCAMEYSEAVRDIEIGATGLVTQLYAATFARLLSEIKFLWQ
jgi:hypothetical protein